MTNLVAIRIEASAESIKGIEGMLIDADVDFRHVDAKSISSFGIDSGLIVDLAKASVPVISAAIGAAAALAVGRSVKVNGIEIRGYSIADIEKLLKKLKDINDRPE